MSDAPLGTTLRYRVLGVVFLVIAVLFVYLTYAVFTKKFVDYVPVSLKTSSIGLQLPALADVKIRGLIVGEVREATSNGEGATLQLAIQPSKAQLIPANVTADIVPKTLFGEKYVALQIPDGPRADHIVAGDVIEQTHVSIEVEKVLRDFYPLLRTVQPEQLNYTLTAIAQALEGRGEAIGENLDTLDSYLKRQNPQLPALIEDLRLLSTVSDTYAEVMPELASTLRSSLVTAKTLQTKDAKVRAFFDDVTGFASTTRDFLQANGDNIIRLSDVSQKQLAVFARYSPEYPCLLNGMVNWVPRMANGWRGRMLHINLEQLPVQPTGYSVADLPKYGGGPGPHCSALPTPPYSQANPGPQPPMHTVDDGVEDGHGKFRPRSAPGFDLTSGFAGTRSERSIIRAIAAPVMGVSSDDVPDLATLLLGPLARGMEVSVR